MLIDLYEKGRSYEEITREEFTYKKGTLIAILGCSAILFSVMLFFFGVFVLNRYICCISLAVLILILTPINTRRVNIDNKSTFEKLKLNIEKYFNRTASVILAVICLLSPFIFDLLDDDLEIKIFYGILFIFIYLTAVFLLKNLLYILFRKRAVERRRERCTLAITANYIGEAVNRKLLDSYEQTSGKLHSDNYIYSALYNRNQYRYLYNGSEYYIFDHGENTTIDDITIYIDPAAPEYYYDENWEKRKG